MAEILKRSRWRPRKVQFYDGPVVFEMKALSKADAPGFLKRMAGMFTVGAVDEAAPSDEQVDQAEKLFNDRFNSPFVKELLTDYIRLPQPFDLDGANITTAMEALEAGEPAFLLHLIVEFHRANSLSADEGNASGSPSASVPVAVPAGSSTDATSTERSPASAG